MRRTSELIAYRLVNGQYCLFVQSIGWLLIIPLVHPFGLRQADSLPKLRWFEETIAGERSFNLRRVVSCTCPGMFNLLSDESVSTMPKRNALYFSLIIHVCACIAILPFSLFAVPPVRFQLTTVYAGSPEPVRGPRPIPLRTVRTSSAGGADVTKAVLPKNEISRVQPNDDGNHDDYTPTAIPSDLSALLDADIRQDAGPGPVLANIGNLSILPPLGERSLPDPPEPPPGNPDVRPPITISHLEPPVLVKQIKPVYPALATTARVDGIVVLEGTINVMGKVENLSVVSGHPMLVDAAVKAVEKWKYRPAKLNGQLIPLSVRIEVRFRLEYPNE